MGNEKAWDFWHDFFSLCQDHKTSEEYEKYPSKLPKKLRSYLICKLVERCYDEIVGMALTKNSRLAFQVLGYFLLSYGAKMTEDVRILILKNSRWVDDRRQLKDKKDRTERRKYLFGFREEIMKYKSGKIIDIPTESVTSVANQVLKKERRIIHNIESYIQRTPILK